MLNDKHKNLKNTVSEVNRTAKEVKQAAEEAVITAEHAQATAQSAREEVKKVEARTIRPEPMPVTTPVYVPEPVLEPTPSPEPVQTMVVRPEPVQEPVRKTESVIRPEPVEEPISYLDDDDDEEDVVPEKSFSSLSDILSRADRAAAEKTQNRVIGSYETDNYTEEIENEITEPVENYEEPVNTYDEPVQQNEYASSNEGSVAKVVSISDASRKKAADFEAAQIQNAGNAVQNDNVNDPISRNQRILEMYKQGKSPVVIARELRLGIGEVKLVIDLAGKHKKNRSSIM
jgi:hypothetical protein